VAFVCGQKVAVLPDVVLLLGAKTAARVAVGGAIHAVGCPWSCMLTSEVKQVRPAPDELLQLVRSRPVVGKKTSLVPSHGHVVDQQGASCGLLCSGVERVLKWLEKTSNFPIEIPYLSCHGPDKFCLVCWEVLEVLRPFGMLDLWAE
jgi:hypothetical protein